MWDMEITFYKFVKIKMLNLVYLTMFYVLRSACKILRLDYNVKQCIQTLIYSQRTLTTFVGVVALRYQHHTPLSTQQCGVDNGVPQFPQT